MFDDIVETKSLFNRWNSDGHTIRAYVLKSPLLTDGVNSGGTTAIVTGTAGTTHGTHYFYTEKGRVYVLQGLSFSVNQNGTFGTSVLTGVKLDGVNLGTLGVIADFAAKYGEDLSLYGTLEMGVKVNCGTGVIGTFTVDSEVIGWKFKSLNT